MKSIITIVWLSCVLIASHITDSMWDKQDALIKANQPILVAGR